MDFLKNKLLQKTLLKSVKTQLNDNGIKQLLVYFDSNGELDAKPIQGDSVIISKSVFNALSDFYLSNKNKKECTECQKSLNDIK